MNLVNSLNKFELVWTRIRVYVFVALIVTGIVLLFQKNKYDGLAVGHVVTEDKCLNNSLCNVEYGFTVPGDNQAYTGTDMTAMKGLKLGGDIAIQYVSSDPSDNRVAKLSMKSLGQLLIAISVIMILILFVKIYIIKSVKGSGTFFLGMELGR